MRLTVLGNNGPYPATGGACSGYLLSSDSGETTLLCECGPGVLSRLTEHTSLEGLDAVLLSHLHYDHMSDMLPMHYALQFSRRRQPLNIYAPREPSEVRALLRGARTDVWGLRDMQLGEFTIRVCAARHPVETFSIAFVCDGKRLVYTGDTNTAPELELFCDAPDLLLADCGLSRSDWSEQAPHLSAAHCGQLARDVSARRLLLTHLNPKYDPEALRREAAEAFPTAELAELGRTYYL